MKTAKAEKGSRKRSTRPRAFRSDSILGYLTIAPAIVVLVGLFIYPLFYQLYTSLTNRSVGQGGEFIGLANYVQLFNDPAFLTASFNTVVYVTLVQLGKFALGLAIAVLLQQPLVLRKLWRSLTLLPLAMPGFVVYMIWRLIYDPDVGALNVQLSQLGILSQPIAFLADGNWAMPAVILASIWQGFPFWTIMFLAALQAIPKERYEAAAIDGANSWQKFRNISLPGIRPVVLIVFLISTITTLNAFEAVWLTTGGGPANSTLIIPIYAYKGLITFQIGQAAAAALTMVPVIIVFVYFILGRLTKGK